MFQGLKLQIKSNQNKKEAESYNETASFNKSYREIIF
jgi:hypothetical protein